MKKLSLFLALAMLLTVSGVYAVWTYTVSNDILDATSSSAITLTAPASTGTTNGTYTITNTLDLYVDPKAGTTHVTALYGTGSLVITFTPDEFAPDDIKNNGVVSYFKHELTNNNWTYDDEKIMDIDTDEHTIALANDENATNKWVRQNDGTFTFTLTAEQIIEHIDLTEFLLDTLDKYHEYDAALEQGQIRFSISDGVVPQP